ncbi:MAG: HAD family hydrolase [Pseudomonadales bacterium]
MTSLNEIKLVALDIDGTLLAPGVKPTALPDSAMTDAVQSLMAAGVTVALATGRMYPGTVRIAEHLGITQPLICQQGASTHALDGTLLHNRSIDHDIARELAAFAVSEGWPYAWFDHERYLVSEPNPASQYFAEVSGVAFEEHAAPHESDVVPVGIDIISTREHAGAIHAGLQERYGDRVELLDFGLVTAVHAAQASKGTALAALAGELGYSAAQVLAIGDSANDASMLRWAGHGAAPEHSDRYARNAADEILTGAGVDGVSSLLRTLSQ